MGFLSIEWDDLLAIQVNEFDSFVTSLFEEFLYWESFFIKVDGQRIGPVNLAEEFEASSHTIEPFTLRTHSIEVLRRCYTLAPFYDLKGILSFKSFSFLLLFHDIGKNVSVIHSGTKKEQHRYTVAILEVILEKKEWSDWFPLFRSVIGMDPLGSFLKGRASLKATQTKSKQAASEANRSENHFFKILELYYFCDASAYTNLRKKIFSHISSGQMILNPNHSRFAEFLNLKESFQAH